MKQRLPIVLSAAALAVAVLGAAPLVRGAGRQGGPVHEVQVVEATSPLSSETFRTVGVKCPPGKDVIGGGAVPIASRAPGFPVYLRYSFPDGDVWRAQAQEATAFAGKWQLKAIAVCAATS